MGSKGLVAHLEGQAKQPVQYILVEGVLMVSTNPNVPATDEQLEAKEKRLSDHKQKEYLAQHLILSSTSPRLSQKILHETTAKAMWDAVKLDATTKSSLHRIDILSEVRNHFEKMTQLREHLRVTQSPFKPLKQP